MKNIDIVKPFDMCVGDDIHPTRFEVGKDVEVTDRVAEVALENGWAKPPRKKSKAAARKPTEPELLPEGPGE